MGGGEGGIRQVKRHRVVLQKINHLYPRPTTLPPPRPACTYPDRASSLPASLLLPSRFSPPRVVDDPARVIFDPPRVIRVVEDPPRVIDDPPRVIYDPALVSSQPVSPDYFHALRFSLDLEGGLLDVVCDRDTGHPSLHTPGTGRGGVNHLYTPLGQEGEGGGSTIL